MTSEDQTKLRRGHAQAPEEAKQEPEMFKQSYSDLAGWKERKKRIREGVLEGAVCRDAVKPITITSSVNCSLAGKRRNV